MAQNNGGHNTPFFLFAKLMECIQLEDIKHHFKVYPKSFRGDSAVSTLVDQLGFERTEAMECIGGVLYAQLIVNAEKPREQELKGKGIYCLSVKGVLVLRDVKAKRMLAETPETVFSKMKVGNWVTTNVVYMDRDMEGNLRMPSATMETVFRHVMGVFPNTTRNENPNVVYVGEAMTEVEVDSSTNLTPIVPLFVRDKVVRMKGYTHAFTGAALVDWILRNTSVVSRVEACAVASQICDNGWAVNVNPDDASTPVAGSPGALVFSGIACPIKDSMKAIYQPSIVGAKLAGWDLSIDTPSTTSAVQGFFASTRKINSGKLESDDREVAMHGRASTADSPQRPSTNDGKGTPVSPNPLRRASSKSGKSEGEIDKLSKSLSAIGVDGPDGEEVGDLYGWESCHTNLISMDGTKARSKASSIAPSAASVGLTTSTSSGNIIEPQGPPSILKLLQVARPKAAAIKKAAAQQYSQAKLPEMLPMDPSIPRDPLVLQLKEKTHLLRLVQILETPELCEQFRKYNHFMYSQENFGFWSEADSFRRLYSPDSAVVIPGQPIALKEGTSFNDFQPTLSQLVPHAMAIYLKYIVDEAPYEVNVGSERKKKITAVATQEELLPFFDLINPESIITDALIDPSKVLLPNTEAMLSSRLALLEKSGNGLGITAALFDVAENHIFSLMATDSVPKFLKTSAYHNTMLACVKAGTLRVEEDQKSSVIREGSPAGGGSLQRESSTSRVSKTEQPDFAKFAADKRNSAMLQPTKEDTMEV